MRLAIPQRMSDDLISMAEKSTSEIVGVLAAKLDDEERVTTMAPLPNHSPTPMTAFFVEPWKQYQVETELAARGYKVVAYYHSHPKGRGDAQPSGSDADQLNDKPMVIIGVDTSEVRAWRRHPDRPESDEVLLINYRLPEDVAA